MQIEIRIDENCKEPKLIVVTDTITEEISTLLKEFSEKQPPMIAGFREDTVEVLEPSDIYRVFAAAGKVLAETDHGNYTLRLRLYEAEQRLDSINHAAHILLFWASWCSDCREETPALLALQKDFPQLAWLTVSLDNEATKARDYVWKNKLSGMHLFDGRDWRGQACEDYAVALHGIPHMVLIDSQGRLAWSGQQTDSLRSAITHLLKAEHSHKAHK